MRDVEMKRVWCAVGLACLVAGAVPGAKANDLCGTTIVADLELDQDLICSGDGLVVGADGIRIKLNGHTITGSGSGAGIVVTGRTDVSIAGGTIRAFAVGVRLNTSTDIVIKDTEFAANAEGIDMQAEASATPSRTMRSGTAPFGPSCSGATRSTTTSRTTPSRGTASAFWCSGASTHVERERRVRQQPGGHSLQRPRDRECPERQHDQSNALGIEFVVTPTGSATGNELKDNELTANGCGLKGPTAGNDFKDNLFLENVADTCA